LTGLSQTRRGRRDDACHRLGASVGTEVLEAPARRAAQMKPAMWRWVRADRHASVTPKLGVGLERVSIACCMPQALLVAAARPFNGTVT
jgi:hypothetical protein